MKTPVKKEAVQAAPHPPGRYYVFCRLQSKALGGVLKFFLVLSFLNPSGPLFAQTNYYVQYQHLLNRTNSNYYAIHSPLVVDTNNTAAKLANVVIPLDAFRANSEFAGIRLGMSMDEVVASWGKPLALVANCGPGPRFTYADVSLNFDTNTLARVFLPRTCQFEQGLRADSPRKAWIAILGVPDASRKWEEMIAYRARGTNQTAIRLFFDEEGEASLAPVLYNDAKLATWDQSATPSK